MTMHKGKGWKADRDRAVMIHAYGVMCHDFHIPFKKRINSLDLARLSNEMLYKINKDLYSQATVKQAKKLAVKMGLVKKPATIFSRALSAMKTIMHNIEVQSAAAQ